MLRILRCLGKGTRQSPNLNRRNQTLPLQQVSGVYSFNQTFPLQQVSGVYRFKQTLPLQQVSGVYSLNQTLPLQQVSGVYSFNQTLPLQQVSGVYRNSRGRWGGGEKLDFKRFSYFLNFFIQKLIILT